jgi:hypothetical protein
MAPNRKRYDWYRVPYRIIYLVVKVTGFPPGYMFRIADRFDAEATTMR